MRTGLIATCAAALLVSLYWTGVLPQIPHQLILPVPYSNDSNGPAFIVRELPGRGKGMIAVRNIRVGILVIWVADSKTLLRPAGRATDSGTTVDFGST
jgi:hypothetical protein